MNAYLASLADTEVDWRGFRITVIREPQLKIPEAQQVDLLNPLTEVVNSGFGTKRRPADIRKHVFETDILILTEEQSQNLLVGFAGFLNLLVEDPDCPGLEGGIKILYLYGTAVRPDFQAQGVASKMFRLAAQLGKGIYTHAAMRTQNSAAYILMAKLTPEFYPRLGVSKPPEIVQIENFIAKMHGMVQPDPVTSIVRSVYNGLMTAEEIVYQGSHPAGKEFCRLGLKVHEGDCVVVVGCLQ